jgi:NAD(P)-dependent dehydrogenase (short-subunit alcohol dehydrogenase family)
VQSGGSSLDEAAARGDDNGMLSRNAFHGRSTAEEVARGRSLAGRRVIVTGGAAGLGLETARVLAKAGADVTIACRSVAAGEAAAEEAKRSVNGSGGSLRVSALDLADFASIRAFAEREDAPIDLLINNAGVMATPLGWTAQGHEMQMGTNHLGHFLLTTLLLPKLTLRARVVNLSSKLHTSGTKDGVLATLESDKKYTARKYKPFGAYGDSKLANVLFTKALQKRLPKGVTTFSLHPGVIPTNLSRHMGLGGSIFRSVGSLFMKNVPQGAATTVFAAVAPELADHPGIYLSDCNEERPSAAASDEALAERVWQISEQIVA